MEEKMDKGWTNMTNMREEVKKMLEDGEKRNRDFFVLMSNKLKDDLVTQLEGYYDSKLGEIGKQMEEIRGEIKVNEIKINSNKSGLEEATINIISQKRDHEESRERQEIKIKNMEEKVRELENKLEKLSSENKYRDDTTA